MPNTTTAKKQLQVSERNRVRNLHYKTVLKTAMKQAKTALESGDDAVAAKVAVSEAIKHLHRTATRRIIKRQNASRRASRLMLAYNRKFATAITEEA